MIIQNGIVYSEKLSRISYVVHGISTRRYRNLSLQRPDSYIPITMLNRSNFLSQLNIYPSQIVNPCLTHNSNIYEAKSTDKGRGAFCRDTMVPNTDGLVTKEKDIYLFVTIADCLPIFFFDPVEKVVGLIHAGWKGTAASISEKMVLKMAGQYGCKPENIIVFFGPSIGPCHYEVGEEVASRFESKFLISRDNKIFLDLRKANNEQLVMNGVISGNIEIANECTACHLDLYSSYREEGEKNYIAMAAVIGLRE